MWYCFKVGGAGRSLNMNGQQKSSEGNETLLSSGVFGGRETWKQISRFFKMYNFLSNAHIKFTASFTRCWRNHRKSSEKLRFGNRIEREASLMAVADTKSINFFDYIEIMVTESSGLSLNKLMLVIWREGRTLGKDNTKKNLRAQNWRQLTRNHYVFLYYPYQKSPNFKGWSTQIPKQLDQSSNP